MRRVRSRPSASPPDADASGIGARLLSFVADRGDAQERLDLAIRRHVPADVPASRTRWQQHIGQGFVRINDRVCRKSARRLVLGDRVVVELPGVRPRRRPSPEAFALDVLYEDADMLAVNKPAGLVVHPTRGYRSGTMLNALLWRSRQWPAGAKPGLVHRLDRQTSGVVLVAKTRDAHASLVRSMAARTMVKEYLAVVYGTPAHDTARVTLALAKDPAHPARVRVAEASGRPSETRFEVLARSTGGRTRLALLRCTLVTGRMHQIRAHLSAMGLPIVGDTVYGDGGVEALGDDALGDACRACARQALHAVRVVVPHPVTQVPLTIVAPLPDDLRVLIECGFGGSGLALMGVRSCLSTLSREG
ncbi:MAG: RluA family pseudouridine synthase [Vicinamibacterales bacterium]